MELSRGECQDLMRRYNIPSTGFYWRKKKAKDREDLTKLLEDYKAMAIKRERRKLEKELNLIKSNANPNRDKIEIPTEILSRDAYNMFLYEHIKRAVSAIRNKFPTVKIDVLHEMGDIINDLTVQVLRCSQDRPLTEYKDWMVNYETGERVLYRVRRNGRVVKEKGKEVVINEKYNVKEPTIEERYKRIDMLFDGWYDDVVKDTVCNKKGEPYIVPGIDLYTKYLREPEKIKDTEAFINNIVNNYFKDDIAKSSNRPKVNSIDAPLGNTSDENALTLADLYAEYDTDDLSIKEAIEHCEGVLYMGHDLGDIIKEILIDETTLLKACKKRNLQPKKVKEQFEKLRLREILGQV